MQRLVNEYRIDRLYRATTTPQLVQVPLLAFLCIDGHGDPNTSPAYATAIQALYSVSYASKFTIKKAGATAFKVSPLEGLWCAEDLSTFLTGDKSEWNWTMMIRQPDVVTADLIARLANEVADKKSIPAARQLRLISFEEGAAAQVLHLGPYAAEAPTIAQLHDFIRERRLTLTAGTQMDRPTCR
jgi:hypothetical protein